MRCWRTRPAMRYSSSSDRSPSTTIWPKRSARLTKSPSGSTTTCCTQGALCSEQAAQQMRLAGAGIALHQQPRRQQFLEIDHGRCPVGQRSDVDLDRHHPSAHCGPVLRGGRGGAWSITIGRSACNPPGQVRVPACPAPPTDPGTISIMDSVMREPDPREAGTPAAAAMVERPIRPASKGCEPLAADLPPANRLGNIGQFPALGR